MKDVFLFDETKNHNKAIQNLYNKSLFLTLAC